VLEAANYHNHSLDNNRNRDKAISNFISTNMWKAANDSINQIQAQRGIDNAVKILKKLCEDSPLAERSK
jgi:hypothetical protein